MKKVSSKSKSKFTNDVLQDLGFKKLGEKTRSHTYIGFQKVDGKRVQNSPAMIKLTQIKRDDEFVTIKSASFPVADILKGVKAAGGIRGLRALKNA